MGLLSLVLAAVLEELLPEELGSSLVDMSVPLRLNRLNLGLFDFFAALILAFVESPTDVIPVELLSASSELVSGVDATSSKGSCIGSVTYGAGTESLSS